MKSSVAIAIFAVIMLIAGAMTAVFILPSFLAQAQTAEYEMSGWAWTENYGWISLNCDNTGDCSPAYDVVVDGAGNVTGWGWSSNVGWICFGATCSGHVPGAGSLTLVDTNPVRLRGDAGVVSLGSDGMIRLGYDGGVTGTTSQGEQCYDCEPKCDTPIIDEGSGAVIGCSAYSTDEFSTCATCFTNTCFGSGLGDDLPDSYCPVGNQQPSGGDPVPGGSGLVCSGFKDCFTQTGPNSSARVFCTNPAEAQCQQFGLRVRDEDGSLLGWGWNGNNEAQDSDDDSTGAGWVKFHGGGAAIVYPWLETRYGSIYVPETGQVRQRTGAARINATYCIFADSIVNVASANCANVVQGINLSFPASTPSELIYRNALGKVDVAGLIAADSENYNKYDQVVEGITLVSDIDNVLGNKVYVASGDLTVGSSISFVDGGLGQRGNGTIVVQGDLYINENISYTSGPSVTDTRQLASVAWIVLGDVIVAPDVDEVAGAFIILGQDAVSCVSDNEQFPQYNQNGCGAFFSGAGSGSLDVLGIVVAKAFDLRRSFSEASRGSERIIYDGRLIANPPPGFRGFIEGLPVIRDFSF